MSLRDLLSEITVSSNFAANLLISASADNVRKTVHRLGADGMVVLRGVEIEGVRQGDEQPDHGALQVLLMTLAQGKAVSAGADADGRGLEAPEVPRRHSAGLPDGTVVRQDGNITRSITTR